MLIKANPSMPNVGCIQYTVLVQPFFNLGQTLARISVLKFSALLVCIKVKDQLSNMHTVLVNDHCGTAAVDQHLFSVILTNRKMSSLCVRTRNNRRKNTHQTTNFQSFNKQPKIDTEPKTKRTHLCVSHAE